MGKGSPRKAITTTYALYDATYLAMTPSRWTASMTQLLLSNPLNPFANTLPARWLAASADVFTGATRRRGKPEWNVRGARAEVIAERPFCRLVRFVRDADDGKTRPRVLLVAPLSGHFATLLRGTVEALLDGHDVYVSDWTDARDVPLLAGDFDLDDYIAYVIDGIRYLGPDVHVIAVCQPAPLVLAAVAIMAAEGDPAQPRSMTLMGGPVDTRVAPTAPTKLAEEQSLAWFENNLLTTVPAWYRGAGRRVYPGYAQLGAFIAMNPERHAEAHREIFADLVRGDRPAAEKRRAFYDEYFAVMDMPATYYLETVARIFQNHDLPRGTLTWRGRRVDPSAIRQTALFTVEGELDDISAPGQTLAAQALCPNIPAERRDHFVQPGVGHYGIFAGSKWRESIAPRIAAFIGRAA